MSVLSPTAMRFITLALDQSGDQRQQTGWHAWTSDPEQTLPGYLAQVVLYQAP